MNVINNDSIQHYGTKGMKWGVRKDQAVSFLRSGSPQQQAGKQIVASIIVSYGAFKIAGFATKKNKVCS